jgi:hypothetical protein
MGKVNRLREVLLHPRGSRFFESPTGGAVRREIGTDGNDAVWGNPKVAWEVVCGG